MKLSIIVPIYRESNLLNKLLEKLKDQTSQKFEIVLVVDTTLENNLDIVEKHSKFFKKRLKLIFNSKRVGRTTAVIAGIKAASGTYSLIINSSDKFNNKMIETAQNILEGKTADIIEFNLSIKSPIKYIGVTKYNVKQKTNICDDKKIIAYAAPFDFNKFYKTSLLKKVALIKKINVQLNSRYSWEIVFKSLLTAKTYQYVNKTLIHSSAKISKNYNPLKTIRQINEIIQWSKNSECNYEAELKYSAFVHITVFLFALTGITKNKVLLTKLNKVYQNQLNTIFKELKFTNKYLMLNNKETMILRKQHKSSELLKLYKEFK